MRPMLIAMVVGVCVGARSAAVDPPQVPEGVNGFWLAVTIAVKQGKVAFVIREGDGFE